MTEELKKALAEAKTDEERKQIIEENKVVLTDEELERVSGGTIIDVRLNSCDFRCQIK